VCVYLNVCCIYVFVCAYVCVSFCVCLYLRLSTYVCARVRICNRVMVYGCVFIFACIRVLCTCERTCNAWLCLAVIGLCGGRPICWIENSLPDAGSPTVYSHFNSGTSCPAYTYGRNTCQLTGADCSKSENWDVKDLVHAHAFSARCLM
jgi:hypothetical protein